MINIGFIGAGDIAGTHAAAIEVLDDARLVAVTDLNFERAKQLAHRYGVTAVGDVDRLLAFPGLDLVYILTPPQGRSQLIATVAQAGLPIFAEKPLALTLAEADEAIISTRQANVPLMTGLSHRYHPLAAQAHALIQAGDLGDLVAVWSHRVTHLDVSPGTWLSQPDLSGGITLQYAMHDLDWELWLGGEVAHVSAQEAHTNPAIEIEDNLWAFLQFSQGGSGTVGVSWSAPHPHTERGLIGSRGNLRIIEQRRLTGRLANGRHLENDLGDGYDWFDVFVRESRDVVTRLKRGEPFSISGEDGRRVLEVCLAVQRAASTQQLVSFK